MKPLCIDLFTGLHGWGEGFLAAGYRVISFDLVDMCAILGVERPPGIELVLQDVLTLHGSQFRAATCIVASPPCQAYSWMAMPWKRAKAKTAAILADRTGAELARLNALFDACFRIQREACEAAGHHIPMVVENVKGAQPWVGRARWHFGSYYLWGDMPALMPVTKGTKIVDLPALNGHDDPRRGRKNNGGSWFAVAHNTESGYGQNPVSGRKGPGGDWFKDGRQGQDACADGLKVPGIQLHAVGFNVAAAQRYREGVKQAGLSGPDWFDRGAAEHSSRSDSRKAASAMIAKIPFPLAQWIAECYKPALEATA